MVYTRTQDRQTDITHEVTMIHSGTFYENIPAFYDLKDIANPAHYHDVPLDWLVAATDVQGSTQAIEDGQYKSVNAIAAASITAVLNAVKTADIPYAFGGDGASILIPPSSVEAVREALYGTQVMAQEQFDLHLRIGIVPVGDVIASGYAVRVAKLSLSEEVELAVFSGGGLSFAESLLKNPAYNDRYGIPPMDDYEADFSGFECRWSEIPSKHEEVVSLMVSTTDENYAEHDRIYHEVIHAIEDIYGDNETRHPMTLRDLKLNFNPMRYMQESRIRKGSANLWHLLIYWIKTLFASYFMNFEVDQWGDYRAQVMQNTDNEKFDDTLRMTISGSHHQRQTLEDYLEERYQQGELVYGIHISERTLMTCIIFDRFSKHVHFVDGADGGYARAARQLKARLKK